MIRVIVTGVGAQGCGDALQKALAGADVEVARLPSAAVREFDRSPADVVILVGPAGKGRLCDVLEALRERPLGRLLPCIVVSDDVIDGADVQLAADAKADQIVAAVGESVGLEVEALTAAPVVARPEPAQAVVDAKLTEAALLTKLHAVRHGTYFAVLEVEPDVGARELAHAYASVWKRFEDDRISAGFRKQFADELAEVRDGLEDAFAVLGSEQLRAVYRDSRRR